MTGAAKFSKREVRREIEKDLAARARETLARLKERIDAARVRRRATTGKAVQDEAVQTAGQVRDVAVDTARSVGDEVKTTAAQVRDDTSKGARAAGKETGDAVQRLRRELNQPADV